jgi:hypothetical protein
VQLGLAARVHTFGVQEAELSEGFHAPASRGGVRRKFITYKQTVVSNVLFYYTSIMALRLNEMVVRGMIDNREKGKVSGELWLAGQGGPIGFELVGNCDRDLAGRLVEFTNRKPEPTASLRMLRDQVGEAGTITAARKVRVIPEDIRLDDLTQEHLKHLDWTSLLYLEWFSRSDGRIVVEIVDPELRVSEPSWDFAADEEIKMQEMAAQPPAAFIHTIEITDMCGENEKLSEFQYEKLLKRFDEHVAEFEELWERYRDDPDANQKIADELGLVLIQDDTDPEESEEDFEGAPEEMEPGKDTLAFPEPRWFQHPLIVRAKDLCVAVGEIRNSEMPKPQAPDRLEDLYAFLLQGMGKLANALHGLVEGDEPRESALLVAMLRRSLSEYHSALEVLERIPNGRITADLEQKWRAEILIIRQEVLNEMNRLRQDP